MSLIQRRCPGHMAVRIKPLVEVRQITLARVVRLSQSRCPRDMAVGIEPFVEIRQVTLPYVMSGP